jgi:hypothetical protein
MYVKKVFRRKSRRKVNPSVPSLPVTYAEIYKSIPRPKRLNKDFWESKIKELFEQRKNNEKRKCIGSTPKKKPEQTKVPTLAEIKKMKKGEVVTLCTRLKKVIAKEKKQRKEIELKVKRLEHIKTNQQAIISRCQNEAAKAIGDYKVVLKGLKQVTKEFEDYKKKAYLPPEPAEKKKDTGRNATVDRFSSLELFTLDEEARDFLKTQKEAEDKKVKKK